MKIEFLQHLHMTHCAFHHGFRADLSVFCQNVLLQGSGVDTDADGNAPILRSLCHSPYLFLFSDIPRIDAQLGHATANGQQRQGGIKMDICDQGNMNLRNDLPESLPRFLIRHCTADNIATCFLQL